MKFESYFFMKEWGGGAGGVHFQTHMGRIRAQMCDGHLAVATLTLSLSSVMEGAQLAYMLHCGHMNA